MTPEIGTLRTFTGAERISTPERSSVSSDALPISRFTSSHAATERAPLEHSQKRYITQTGDKVTQCCKQKDTVTPMPPTHNG